MQKTHTKCEKVGLDHSDDPKDFIEYSNDMQDVYKNIEDYNPRKNRKVLIVFDDMIADMINNKNLDSIVTEFLPEAEKFIFLLSLLANQILKCQKIKYYTFFYYENS